jgi:uncharacterized protein YkwD
MMRRLAGVIAVAFVSMMNGACGGGDSVPVPDVLVNHGQPAVDSGEQEMIGRHNDARAAQGLGALTANAQLSEIAQNQANYMADIGKFQHTDASDGTVQDRATAVGYAWTTIGENVGFDMEAQNLFDGWMESSGHRANILDADFEEIGVGRATRGLYQYWCVDFGSR